MSYVYVNALDLWSLHISLLNFLEGKGCPKNDQIFYVCQCVISMVITDQLAESFLEGEGCLKSVNIFEDLRCNSVTLLRCVQGHRVLVVEYSEAPKLFRNTNTLTPYPRLISKLTQEPRQSTYIMIK